MTRSGLQTVLSVMRRHDVKCLLMGGQACVLYGASEFTKDVDFAVLAEPDNLKRIGLAMEELQAIVIAVPPFSDECLDQGLSVHFRCQAVDVEGFRVDIMTRMRGVDSFQTLWNRRSIILDTHGNEISVLNVRDLVKAKKTQRDKDWPMIQRLMEVQYLNGIEDCARQDIDFWLQELRTPELLIEAVQKFSKEADVLSPTRPLLKIAMNGDVEKLDRALMEEVAREKEKDRQHWAPLRERLAQYRREARGDH
jgi:hypothetical protein